MRQVVFAVPGDLATATGGYVYDRRIIAELPKHGWQVEVLNIGSSFPRPSAAERATAHLQLAATPASQPIVIDGLAFGVMSRAAEDLHRSHRLVALVHHPLALETGLQEWEAAKLRASERLALSFARRIVTTSRTTARLLVQTFAVPEETISIVLPGSDRVPLPRRPDDGSGGDGSNRAVNILAVGSIVPRKGYDLLIKALAQITDLRWQLVIAGDPNRSPATAQALQQQVASSHLTERVKMLGVLTEAELAGLYEAADLFVLPSRYEGYGMAFTEAIAYGLPVIGTTAGAIPEAVPPGAGVLVPADSIGDLALALMRLIGSPDERARFATAARAAAAVLPTWDEAGRRFSQALDQVVQTS